MTYMTDCHDIMS